MGRAPAFILSHAERAVQWKCKLKKGHLSSRLFFSFRHLTKEGEACNCMQGRHSKPAEPGGGESTSAAGATPPICPAAQLEKQRRRQAPVHDCAWPRRNRAGQRKACCTSHGGMDSTPWKTSLEKPEGDNSTSTAADKRKRGSKVLTS
jgi:hypothetical protein